MNKELIKSFIDKWNVGYEDKEQKAEFAADMEADLMAVLQPTQPVLSAEEMVDILNAYRNQPVQLTPTTEVYNGIPKVTIVGSFTQPRPPKEEAERLYNELGHFKSIAVIEYTRDALQLRGIDTTYEEEVLTILRGM